MSTNKSDGMLPLLDELNYTNDDIDLSKSKKKTIYDDVEEEEVFSPINRGKVSITKKQEPEVIYIEDFDDEIEDITDEDLGNEVEEEYDEEPEPFIRQVIDIDSIEGDKGFDYNKLKKQEINVEKEEEEDPVHKLSKMPKLKSSKNIETKNLKELLKNPKMLYILYGVLGIFIIIVILLMFSSSDSNKKESTEKVPVITKVIVNDNSYAATIKKGTTINGTVSLYGAIKTKHGVAICSATDAPTRAKESVEVLLECDLQPQDNETIEDFVFDVTTE